MRDRIHYPYHGGALHPGTKLGNCPANKVKCIIGASESPELIQLTEFYHSNILFDKK